MNDQAKTRDQLLTELATVRERLRRSEAQEREYRRKARELQESEALLRSAVDSAPVDFWARDCNGKCIVQSRRSIENWGNRFGRSLQVEEVDAETLEIWRQNNEKALGGEVVDEVIELTTPKHGRRLFHNVVGPIVEGAAVKGVLGLNVDVTDCERCKRTLLTERERLRDRLDLQAKERELLAYEIHDGLIQQLSAASHYLQRVPRLRTKDPEKAIEGLQKGLEQLHRGIDEARRMINGLQPPVLEDAGVLGAVAHLVREYRERSGMDVELHHDIRFGRLEQELELGVFRTIQEALNNVVRHSTSKKTRVRLAQDGDRLLVEVEDWGVGFDPKQVPAGHYGLKGIRERARLLGGHATIDSESGKGTRIFVELPLAYREPREADTD